MRGVFDEREAERERRKRGRETRDRDDGREEKRDREVTLGSFTLLAILGVLVVLCGLSFGLGYVVGRREPAAPSAVLEPTPIAAQVESAKSKPSGGAGVGPGSGSGSGVAAADEAAGLQGAEESGQHAGGLPPGSDAGDTGAEAGATEAGKATGTGGTGNGAQSGAGTPQVRPALAVEMSKPQAAQSKNAQAAAVKTVQPSPGLGSTKTEAGAPVALMVQVATLAHQEDADVLVEALKRRGYAVAAHRDTDGMVHVRVGPFDSRDVANQWRQKLMNDGYNAVVQGP